MISLNYWAVVVAAAVQIAIGIVWYGPLFGKIRDRLQGLPGDAGNNPAMYILSIVNNLVLSFVLGVVITFNAMPGAWSGIEIALLLWLGFVATREATMSIWEGRPWKVWLINVGYYLVGFIAMGAIFGAWR